MDPAPTLLLALCLLATSAALEHVGIHKPQQLSQSHQAQPQQLSQSQSHHTQPQQQSQTRCVPPADAPAKLEAVIEQCQDEIKQAVLEEALQALGDVGRDGLNLPETNRTTRETLEGLVRSKRETFSGEERRIAGCLLQCVYRKVKAVDENGMPTMQGLIRLYSDGVSDRQYFLATLQAVHSCLTLAENRRAFNTQAVQDGGYTCDLAYDMFNCVSDRIEAICGSQP